MTLNFQILLHLLNQTIKNMSCADLAFILDFNHYKTDFKNRAGILASSTFKGTHSIAAYYLHFAPNIFHIWGSKTTFRAG